MLRVGGKEKRPAIARIKSTLLLTKGRLEPKLRFPGDKSSDLEMKMHLIACLNEIKELNVI
jgi:hypothetical protein